MKSSADKSGPHTVSAVLWSVTYAHHDLAGTVRTILLMVLVEFFAVGLVISTALW